MFLFIEELSKAKNISQKDIFCVNLPKIFRRSKTFPHPNVGRDKDDDSTLCVNMTSRFIYGLRV